ncbi:MAG: hypothetical protein GXP55_17710 [Deltaproteobacteria bacterium]|nr:hypothetical protein [Deltaproteobacteria bacterium]
MPLRHGVPHWVAPEVFDPWGNDDPNERLRAFRPDEHRLTVSAREQARKIRRCFLEVPSGPVYRVTSAARQPADTPVSRCLRAVLSGLTHSRPYTLALRFDGGTLVEVIVVRASAAAPPTRHGREPTRGEVLDPYQPRLK